MHKESADFLKLPKYNHPLVNEAFNIAVGVKLYNDGYYNMSEYLYADFTMHGMREKLKDSFVYDLYKQPLPQSEEEGENTFRLIFERYYHSENFELSEIEAKAILFWVFRSFRYISDRREFTREIIGAGEGGKYDLRYTNDIIFDNRKVELYFVNSVAKYTEYMKYIKSLYNGKLFYRGHSKLNYILIPSIMRRDVWYKNERKMYNELKMRCTDEFMTVKTHLEYLVKMQHYGLPTRLLDITTNPLVALYFACQEQKERFGEVIVFGIEAEQIKYPNSDSVSIIASLPAFTYKEQQDIYMDSTKMSLSSFNDKNVRLLHEIKQEKPAFRNIIEPRTIRDNFFVMSDKNNKRIIKQDGEFIICGLAENKYNKSNELSEMRAKNGKKNIVLVCEKKQDILDELDTYSINNATLFPEIENVAEYVKEHV